MLHFERRTVRKKCGKVVAQFHKCARNSPALEVRWCDLNSGIIKNFDKKPALPVSETYSEGLTRICSVGAALTRGGSCGKAYGSQIFVAKL